MPLVPYLLPPGLCPAAERGGLTVYSDIALDSSSLCNVQVWMSIARLSHFTLGLVSTSSTPPLTADSLLLAYVTYALFYTIY